MVIKIFIWLMAVCCCAFAVLENRCPPPEETPCTCTMENSIYRKGVVLHCDMIRDLENLKRLLNQLPGYQIHTLILQNANVSSFPVNLFKGLHVKYLELIRFEVDDASFGPGQRHFQGLEETLFSLIIRKSFLRQQPLTNLKLDHMKGLGFISLSGNNIPKVGNDWFSEEPSSLEAVMFNNNKIKKLEDKAFKSLKNLNYLYLSENHLTEISRSMFPSSAEKLKVLDLSDNEIRALPSDIFSGMPSLSSIYLYSNFIHEFREDTWSTILPQLQYLNLEDNILVCDNQMKWVCRFKFEIITGNCAAPFLKKGKNISDFCKRLTV